MIVDTSAIMAIVLGEPEESLFTDVLFRASNPLMSVATFVALTAVIVERCPAQRAAVDLLIETARITLTPVSIPQARIASTAYATYGRGTGHPAKLNFGDCFAYALAKSANDTLLFKGDDFTHTDVLKAINDA
jgi:ribonuclease VapC